MSYLAAYVRKFDVINRGLSGYQTDWAIPVFEQVIRRQWYAIASIDTSFIDPGATARTASRTKGAVADHLVRRQ